MRFLYVFPHPDDESFGPAAAMHQQLQQGHEVHLLTLTKGEATKMRHKLGYEKEKMGEVRFQEMKAVERSLGLSSMEVWDLPDSGLKELDPREIEEKLKDHVRRIDPEILVSYPVHGISGFHDHLVMHAVAKRAYMDLKEETGISLARLAFYTIPDRGYDPFEGKAFPVRQSTEEEIDCVLELSEADHKAFRDALDCYETYKETIERSGVKEKVGYKACYELFQEQFDPPLKDLTLGL